MEMVKDLAARIPNARFVVVEGSWADDPEGVAHRISGFINTETQGVPTDAQSSPTNEPLDPSPPPTAAESVMRTVLFTDVVENTALLWRIGDDAWRAVMRDHNEIVRSALKEHGGVEVSNSGDGFFASFVSSVRALECAMEMQRAFARRNENAEHPIEVRIGLNAGEPIAEGDDVVGTAVTMAARIMSQAGAGEILVSDALRQLVAGKGFLFADRGQFVAKGFEEPVRVYEVRWH
jgi:class 3 adenylate cyclase